MKQGGVTSPILFNIDMDELSIALNSWRVLRNCFFFHYLCYTGDLGLISLSSTEMQQFSSICQNYAFEHHLLCNCSVSYFYFLENKSHLITLLHFS